MDVTIEKAREALREAEERERESAAALASAEEELGSVRAEVERIEALPELTTADLLALENGRRKAARLVAPTATARKAHEDAQETRQRAQRAVSECEAAEALDELTADEQVLRAREIPALADALATRLARHLEIRERAAELARRVGRTLPASDLADVDPEGDPSAVLSTVADVLEAEEEREVLRKAAEERRAREAAEVERLRRELADPRRQAEIAALRAATPLIDVRHGPDGLQVVRDGVQR